MTNVRTGDSPSKSQNSPGKRNASNSNERRTVRMPEIIHPSQKLRMDQILHRNPNSTEMDTSRNPDSSRFQFN